MVAKRAHDFVPTHEVLSDAEAEKVLQKFNTTREKLPKILITDPQAKALDAKIGQIIKIHREDMSNEIPYYRVVVN